MSVYATFFCLDEDEEHEDACSRFRPPREDEKPNVFFAGGLTAVYDDAIACDCGALGGPYRYEMSNQSITGPDHPRDGAVLCCRAVGTWTMRLSVHSHQGDATVLLDRRQVEAMRDALTRFLDRWDDPADYGRENAWDAVMADTPERVAQREETAAEFEAWMARMQDKAERVQGGEG